jgi:hypothetical protein
MAFVPIAASLQRVPSVRPTRSPRSSWAVSPSQQTKNMLVSYSDQALGFF